MQRTWTVLGLTLATACGGKAAPDPAHLAAPPITVGADEPLGVLALATATARTDGLPYWVPITGAAPAVVPPEAALTAGTSYLALAATPGDPQTLTAGPSVNIEYGCDGNTSDFLPLAGPALAPGVAWVLPASPPAGWEPAAVALVADGATTKDHRGWRAGPLAIALDRKDDSHATLTIARDGATVHSEALEVWAMEGAEPGALDFSSTETFVGIAMPVGVFALGPAGPWLASFDRSGYEGVAFQTLLVGAGATRAIDSLSMGLYYCAF